MSIRAEYFTRRDRFGFQRVTRIRIYRNGVLKLDRRPHPICRYCIVMPGAPGSKAIHIRQLDSTAEFEVAFDLFSGGAHCCFYDLIFRFQPLQGTYSGRQRNWRDVGYHFVHLRGSRLSQFMSADARFAYRFGSYAESRFPIQIWTYDRGRFLDKTRSFPRVVARDARKLRRSYGHKRGHANVRPILAAYVADECLLRHCRVGFHLIHRALHRGYLGHQHRYEVGPTGRKYVHKLKRLLRRTGYLRG